MNHSLPVGFRAFITAYHDGSKVSVATLDGIFGEMSVLWHRSGFINETWVGRSILRLEAFNGINIARSGDDNGIVFELFELRHGRSFVFS